MNKKDFINEFKKLKDIKADDSLKFKLYEKITKEIEENFVIKAETSRLINQRVDLNVEQISIFQKILLKQKTMIIPIILIMALMGGGAGATYASQSSLPGEILYPVKIVSEKMQTVLTINDIKQAELHLKFSSKRLEEIEKLADQQKADEQIIKSAVANYQNELTESGNALISSENENNQEKAAEIAKKIADSTLKNKLSLAKISGKIENRNALNALKNALEKADEHGDVAILVLLQNTSALGIATSTDSSTTSTTKLIYGYQIRVLNKIAEAKHKIAETEKFLTKKEKKGVDVAEAKIQVNNAKLLINEAESLLAQDKFIEAFLKAKEAHKTAQIAKKSLENKDDDDDEDKEDSKRAFMINYILNGASTSATSTVSSVKEIIELLKENERKENEFKKAKEIDNKNNKQGNRKESDDEE